MVLSNGLHQPAVGQRLAGRSISSPMAIALAGDRRRKDQVHVGKDDAVFGVRHRQP